MEATPARASSRAQSRPLCSSRMVKHAEDHCGGDAAEMLRLRAAVDASPRTSLRTPATGEVEKQEPVPRVGQLGGGGEALPGRAKTARLGPGVGRLAPTCTRGEVQATEQQAGDRPCWESGRRPGPCAPWSQKLPYAKDLHTPAFGTCLVSPDLIPSSGSPAERRTPRSLAGSWRVLRRPHPDPELWDDLGSWPQAPTEALALSSRRPAPHGTASHVPEPHSQGTARRGPSTAGREHKPDRLEPDSERTTCSWRRSCTVAGAARIRTRDPP